MRRSRPQKTLARVSYQRCYASSTSRSPARFHSWKCTTTCGNVQLPCPRGVFTRLSLSTELRKVMSPAELRGGAAATTKLTRLSNLEKYEQRGHELPSKEPHPESGEVFQGCGRWTVWCARASWWDWCRLVWMTRERGGGALPACTSPREQRWFTSRHG